MPNEAALLEPTVGAKIGPNALTQTVRALREVMSESQLADLLQQCNQEFLLHEAVAEMVDERAFGALVETLAAELGVEQARQVLYRSGQLTAGYLLRHRIPRPFQWLLRPLPHRPALKLLLMAISQHAWTFVGSGDFRYNVDRTTRLTVATPIRPAEAVCGFYGGTFAHLIQVLINAQARLETSVSRQDGCVYLIKQSQD